MKENRRTDPSSPSPLQKSSAPIFHFSQPPGPSSWRDRSPRIGLQAEKLLLKDFLEIFLALDEPGGQLGREIDPPADFPDGLPQERLAFPSVVDVGRIEVVDALFDGVMNEVDGLFFVDGLGRVEKIGRLMRVSYRQARTTRNLERKLQPVWPSLGRAFLRIPLRSSLEDLGRLILRLKFAILELCKAMR
jgi:hypothetical protein